MHTLMAECFSLPDSSLSVHQPAPNMAPFMVNMVNCCTLVYFTMAGELIVHLLLATVGERPHSEQTVRGCSKKQDGKCISAGFVVTLILG